MERMKRRRALEWMLKGAAVGIAASVAPKLVFGSQNEISDITTVVNDSNFATEVSGHKGKAIVLFYGMWGGESAKIFPLFKELVKEYNTQVKFCSYELDESYNDWQTDENAMGKWKKLKENYGVDLIPTINLYVDGALNDYVRGCPTNKVPEKVIKEYIAKWIKDH